MTSIHLQQEEFSLQIRNLGMTDYDSVWSKMKNYTQSRTTQSNDEVWFTEHHDIYTLGAVGLTISPDSFGKTQDSKLQNNFVVATVERFKRSLHLLNSTAQYRRTKYSPLRKENEEGFSRAKLHGPVHVSCSKAAFVL